MKSYLSTILLFGHDEHLLVTRQWVLQSRGYRVVRVERISQFFSFPENLDARVLLLCHSLRPKEVLAAKEVAKTRWPEIQFMSLAAERPNAPSGLLGQLLHTLDGPDRLLAAVGELVSKSVKTAENPAA